MEYFKKTGKVDAVRAVADPYETKKLIEEAMKKRSRGFDTYFEIVEHGGKEWVRIRDHWKSLVGVGDWIIMHKNGCVKTLSDQDFRRKYVSNEMIAGVPRAEFYEKAFELVAKHKIGLSAKAILLKLTGIDAFEGKADGRYYPFDTGDMGLCLNLLKTFPALRKDLGQMKEVHPGWIPIIDNWDELEKAANSDDYWGFRKIVTGGEGDE